MAVHLSGVSYEEAIRLIVESKGLAFLKEKNVDQGAEPKQVLETEAVEARLVTLSYAKAEDVERRWNRCSRTGQNSRG